MEGRRKKRRVRSGPVIPSGDDVVLCNLSLGKAFLKVNADWAAITHLTLVGCTLRKIHLPLQDCVSLRWLDVSDNELRRFRPEHAAAWADLRYIRADHNALKELPEAWPLLEKADFSFNALTRVPGCWKRIERLRLSNNAITELPEEAVGWSNLSVLDLSNNRLSGVLPGEWESLTVLLLMNNPGLEALPESCSRWTRLMTLGLESTRISRVPPEGAAAWKLLKKASFGKHVHSLPPEAGNWTHLESVFFFSDKMTRLPLQTAAWSKLQYFYAPAHWAHQYPFLFLEDKREQRLRTALAWALLEKKALSAPACKALALEGYVHK